MPVRLFCSVCASVFLTPEAPEGRSLCPRCHTVAAAVKKHSPSKLKPPNDSPGDEPTKSAEKRRK
jgi:hypothetical protein